MLNSQLLLFARIQRYDLDLTAVIGVAILVVLAVGTALYALSKSGHVRLPKLRTLVSGAVVAVVAVPLAYLATAAVPEMRLPTLDRVPPEEIVISQDFAEEFQSALQDVSAVDQYGDLASHVRSIQYQQSATEVPHWIFQRPRRDGDAFEVVVASGLYATSEEARADAMQIGSRLATDYLYQHVDETREESGAWSVPPDLVSRHAVCDAYTSTVRHDFGNFTAPMHRVFVQLRFSPETYRVWWQDYRDAVVFERLWGLGGVVGLLTLAFGIIASYFRLDALTGGAYRLRLKLAATSLILAGGVLTGLFLVPNGEKPSPPETIEMPSTDSLLRDALGD